LLKKGNKKRNPEVTKNAFPCSLIISGISRLDYSLDYKHRAFGMTYSLLQQCIAVMFRSSAVIYG
jgi:hypothetical protein